MSNECVDLSVGAIISMNGVNAVQEWSEVTYPDFIQFEDIYLTDSEEFWQEQQLILENFSSELSMCEVTSALLNDRHMAKIMTTDDTVEIANISSEQTILSDVANERKMCEIVLMDPAVGLMDNDENLIVESHSSSEQTILSDVAKKRAMSEIVTTGGAVDFMDNDSFSLIVESHSIMDTSIEEDPSIADMMMGDQPLYMQPEAGSVVRTNETSSTPAILPVQCSNMKIVSQSVPTLQDGLLVPQNTVVERLNQANQKRSCDNSKMFVRGSKDKQPKKLCCPFCLKCFAKLARHLATVHKKEQDVKKFINLPKGSKERRFIQDTLRKAGTNIWNSDDKLNKNELIPSRRHSGDTNAEATLWTSCPYCLGSYTKNNLRHHVAACNRNTNIKPNQNQRVLSKLATIVEYRIHTDASPRLVTVMAVMRQDEIVRLVKFDWLLVVYGNKLCCRYTPHYQSNMIRARLRLIGRVFAEMKKLDPVVTDFASVYHVERYRCLVDAIRNIGRFNPYSCEFGAPAMAAFAVTAVKLIGKYLHSEYIGRRDRENKIETEDFLAYMDTDIDISINKLVIETQAKMRRLKIENIPTMDDVKKLIRHINSERNVCFLKLNEAYSYESWLKLAELTVAWIIVFNRRRVGEVQNILVHEFLGRQSIDDDSNEEILSSLTAEAKLVAKKFKRMKIRGKKGRTVPVLLKPAIDRSIQLLLDCRSIAGLSTDNPFLFELPSSSKLQVRVVDACKVLRELSVACGASNPTSLRGTTLRKHMATTCVSLELNEALISEVAQYMGHDVKIHREYYRKNPIEREVVQMAEILEKAAGKCDMDDSDDVDEDNGGLISGDRLTITNNTNCGTTSLHIETADDDILLENSEPPNLPNEFGKEIDAGKKKCKRIPWTKEEIVCVKEVFATHFRKSTLPVQSEIEAQQAANPVLRSRTWQQIKAYVNNQKAKRTK